MKYNSRDAEVEPRTDDENYSTPVEGKEIELYQCSFCDTKMTLGAIGYSTDEDIYCDDCFNGAIARAENAYDASIGK